MQDGCDKCGRILGPAGYTRRGNSGNGARENTAVMLKGPRFARAAGRGSTEQTLKGSEFIALA
jgi:hypothetical protein